MGVRNSPRPVVERVQADVAVKVFDPHGHRTLVELVRVVDAELASTPQGVVEVADRRLGRHHDLTDVVVGVVDAGRLDGGLGSDLVPLELADALVALLLARADALGANGVAGKGDGRSGRVRDGALVGRGRGGAVVVRLDHVGRGGAVVGQVGGGGVVDASANEEGRQGDQEGPREVGHGSLSGFVTQGATVGVSRRGREDNSCRVERRQGTNMFVIYRRPTLQWRFASTVVFSHTYRGIFYSPASSRGEDNR